MRIEIRLRDLIWLVLLVVVLAAARSTSGPAPDQEPAAPLPATAAGWGYILVSSDDLDRVLADLKAKGEEGWELVVCYLEDSGMGMDSKVVTRCYLKKPLP